ncbi:hypothetical protein AMECASPLE_039116 [Ameca splendens]|uniref:Uncharacterized protein n=1 Tax=Ameca splendens TaxID=208324 RepID=A0ABV0YVG1_9TELE
MDDDVDSGKRHHKHLQTTCVMLRSPSRKTNHRSQLQHPIHVSDLARDLTTPPETFYSERRLPFCSVEEVFQEPVTQDCVLLEEMFVFPYLSESEWQGRSLPHTPVLDPADECSWHLRTCGCGLTLLETLTRSSTILRPATLTLPHGPGTQTYLKDGITFLLDILCLLLRSLPLSQEPDESTSNLCK